VPTTGVGGSLGRIARQKEEVEMDQDKTKAGSEGDESLLDRAEEALLGENEEPDAGAEDRDGREDTGDKPFLKSP
jgi:hypothetical protein